MQNGHGGSVTGGYHQPNTKELPINWQFILFANSSPSFVETSRENVSLSTLFPTIILTTSGDVYMESSRNHEVRAWKDCRDETSYTDHYGIGLFSYSLYESIATRGLTEDHTLSASVIARGQSSESLLSCRVPDAEFVSMSFYLELFHLEIDADSSRCFFVL